MIAVAFKVIQLQICVNHVTKKTFYCGVVMVTAQWNRS